MPNKFTPDVYWQTYEVLSRGGTVAELQTQLGVSPATWSKWVKKYPSLPKAIKRAKGTHKENTSVMAAPERADLQEYIYGALPPYLQELWDSLTNLDPISKNGQILRAKLLDKSGLRVRQQLFVHAWAMNHFKINKAMTFAGISITTYKKWLEDPQFAEMVDNIMCLKQAWFEEAMIDLVQMRHPAAVIAANKGINQAIYNPKVIIQDERDPNDRPGADVDQLDLSVDVRRALIDSMQAAAEQKLAGNDDADDNDSAGPLVMGPKTRVIEGEVLR